MLGQRNGADSALVILLPAPIGIGSERIIAQDTFDSSSMPKPDKFAD
jgi:hypothetical protein